MSGERGQRIINYLKMDWTATIVLQSDSVSSSPAFELSLLTMTMLSARLIPASSKSSRLQQHGDHRWLVGVEFNAPPDTVQVISETVFTANHLTDTDKQNSTGKYR